MVYKRSVSSFQFSVFVRLYIKLLNLLYFQQSIVGFPVSQDPMACRECQVFPGLKDPREETVLRGKLVVKNHKECRVQEETGDRGWEGPPGKSGPRGIKGIKGQPGLVGVKGERGIVGNRGRKGDKGEKGESAKASQASVVPQTNWKQCVRKSESDTDNGKIKAIRIRIIHNTLQKKNNHFKSKYFKEERLPSHPPFAYTLYKELSCISLYFGSFWMKKENPSCVIKWFLAMWIRTIKLKGVTEFLNIGK